MKVSVRIEEISSLFKNEIPKDTSVYVVVKHTPEDYSEQTENVTVTDEQIVFSDQNEFNFTAESTTEPVVITVLNSNDEEIASYALGLTDFTDGESTEKVFDLMPADGYSENAKIKLQVLVQMLKTKDEEEAKKQPEKPTPKSPHAAQGIVIEEDDIEEEDSAEEIKAGRTKEERNRDKARLLNQNYDEIYAAARNVAEERYRLILEKNAQLLLENEEWINESGENGNEENNAQENLKKVDSSDSD
ncbi:hypothetical protein M9Y10_022648 [Tritrichomonas musculus]|uniref:C2 NT-type domain-containing protein n=1 Tax=Tritrichomonas musculus TaxID=1915356 RepID=A0ABR2KT01_9EUKA